MTVPDELLAIFRLCFLVLLYLFFFRVLRAVWTEVNTTVTVVPSEQLTRRQAKKAARVEAKQQRQADRQVDASNAAPPPAPTTPSRLVVVAPDERAGTEYRLTGSITFGRSSAATVLIDDTFLSQRHASVDEVAGEWRLSDLDSTNGTFLNGVKITASLPLKLGDRIQMGSVVMEVH